MPRVRNRLMSLTQMTRATGQRLHLAFRRARAGLWRFKRSPERQDRATAIATFAFIGLFAIGSVDAVVTGGADFGPSAAYAMEYQAIQTRAVATAVTVVTDTAPEPIETALDEVDYSFTTEELLGGPNDVAAPAEAAAPKKAALH